MTERVEEISAELHTVYLATARRLGWAVRPDVDVPYDALSENAKELDRELARWHLTALAQAEREREIVVEDNIRLMNEVERLRADWQTYLDTPNDVVRTLRAEVERLKRELAGAHDTYIPVLEGLARVRAALTHEYHRNHERAIACAGCAGVRAALEGRK